MGRDPRSEEHTSELQSLSLPASLPICIDVRSGLQVVDSLSQVFGPSQRSLPSLVGRENQWGGTPLKCPAEHREDHGSSGAKKELIWKFKILDSGRGEGTKDHDYLIRGWKRAV